MTHAMQPIKPTLVQGTDREATDVICSCGWRGRTSQAWVGDDLAKKARDNHRQHVRRVTA